MDSYAVKVIRESDDSVNAVEVEAARRVHYGPLSHLSRADFAREVALLAECEAQEPGFLRGCCHGAAHKVWFDAYEGRRSIRVFLR